MERPHDKEGNDAADLLAVAGASANQMRDSSRAMQVQLQNIMQIQRMMLSVAQCRIKRQQATAEHTSERDESSSSSGHSSSSDEATADSSASGSSAEMPPD